MTINNTYIHITIQHIDRDWHKKFELSTGLVFT